MIPLKQVLVIILIKMAASALDKTWVCSPSVISMLRSLDKGSRLYSSKPRFVFPSYHHHMNKGIDSSPIVHSRFANLYFLQDTFRDDFLVSIKVLHSHNNALGAQEAECLWKLNQADPDGFSPTLRLYVSRYLPSEPLWMAFIFNDLLPVADDLHL